jgi:UPF0716 protein FxsA
MLRSWPVLFVVVPLFELYLIIKVGSAIGALWTVLLVVMTAVIGVQMLKIQGLSTLRRARENLDQGALPAMEMMEGLLLAVGGVLLITPGFITDTLGFLCLIPATRQAMVRYLMSHATIVTRGFGHGATYTHNQGAAGPKDYEPGRTRTIEGEYERRDH